MVNQVLLFALNDATYEGVEEIVLLSSWLCVIREVVDTEVDIARAILLRVGRTTHISYYCYDSCFRTRHDSQRIVVSQTNSWVDHSRGESSRAIESIWTGDDDSISILLLQAISSSDDE